MRVIFEQPWSYIFFEKDGEHYLTMLLGTSSLVDVTVRIPASQEKFIPVDLDSVNNLVELIRGNWQEFKSWQVLPTIWP